MALRDVNDRQRAILGWIAEGCPERDWPDETHKHSARALASRGLVKVSRSSGRWSAALTEDGKYVHQHGKYPLGHRFGPKPPEPARPVDAPTAAEPVSKRGRSKAPSNDTVNNWAVDSPLRLKRRGKGTLAGSPADAPTHPWDERVLISVKEAAWLLSVSEGLIREAVRTGDIDRVYIGAAPPTTASSTTRCWHGSTPCRPNRCGRGGERRPRATLGGADRAPVVRDTATGLRAHRRSVLADARALIRDGDPLLRGKGRRGCC